MGITRRWLSLFQKYLVKQRKIKKGSSLAFDLSYDHVKLYFMTRSNKFS
jgi:hypothetical protein